MIFMVHVTKFSSVSPSSVPFGHGNYVPVKKTNAAFATRNPQKFPGDFPKVRLSRCWIGMFLVSRVQSFFLT